eukprot:5515295-Pleurochrysis_carterae.AAC.1
MGAERHLIMRHVVHTRSGVRARSRSLCLSQTRRAAACRLCRGRACESQQRPPCPEPSRACWVRAYRVASAAKAWNLHPKYGVPRPAMIAGSRLFSRLLLFRRTSIEDQHDKNSRRR